MLKRLIGGHGKGLLLHEHYFIQAQRPTGDLFSVALNTIRNQVSDSSRSEVGVPSSRIRNTKRDPLQAAEHRGLLTQCTHGDCGRCHNRDLR